MASRRRRATRVWCRPFCVGQQLTVLLSNEAECSALIGAEGVSHSLSSSIVVDESCSTERGEETLVHEMLHHIFDLTGARHNIADELGMDQERWSKLEERIIRYLSPAIVGSFKQNKWLKLPKRPGPRGGVDIEVSTAKRKADR